MEASPGRSSGCIHAPRPSRRPLHIDELPDAFGRAGDNGALSYDEYRALQERGVRDDVGAQRVAFEVLCAFVALFLASEERAEGFAGLALDLLEKLDGEDAFLPVKQDIGFVSGFEEERKGAAAFRAASVVQKSHESSLWMKKRSNNSGVWAIIAKRRLVVSALNGGYG